MLMSKVVVMHTLTAVVLTFRPKGVDVMQQQKLLMLFIMNMDMLLIPQDMVLECGMVD
jgi:hypothetical protein